MKNYLTIIYLYGTISLKRGLRDPLTIIIFFGLPIGLLVIFSLFLGGSQNVNLRTTVTNHSQTEFATDFEKALRDLEVFEFSDEELSLDEAKQQIREGKLDTIIELPENFGAANDQKLPAGDIVMYISQSNIQTSQIATGIVQSVADQYNRQIIGIPMPLNISILSVDSTDAKAIHHIFPIFIGLGLLMVGSLGVASVMPTDRKSQILRRLKATPIESSQVILGTGFAFTIMGIVLAVIMLLIAMVAFHMNVPSSNLITLGIFTLVGLISLVGLGLAIGSWAKNPTQGESVGQIIFLVSMGLSGVWFPVALMPEFLQNIVAFMPLTPIIDGIRIILTEGASLRDLLPQLAVISVWSIITYTVSFKIFRWE